MGWRKFIIWITGQNEIENSDGNIFYINEEMAKRQSTKDTPKYNQVNKHDSKHIRYIEVTDGNKTSEKQEYEKKELEKKEADRQEFERRASENLISIEDLRENILATDRNTEFVIDIEKIQDKGEDAPPLLLRFADNSKLLSVADGMGGAGGTIYQIDKHSRSGAYLASRTVNTVVERFFLELKKNHSEINQSNAPDLAHRLKDKIDQSLDHILNKISKNGNLRSNIKSNLIKRLPTTLALTYIKYTNGAIELFNFWAGDSRIYILDSITGLNQLTTDDLRVKSDAYENLLNDSPISNCINADTNYFINVNRIICNSPKIVFATTDGSFGYVATPIHYEFLLLRTLIESDSISDWKDKLRHQLIQRQSDDISMALSIIGFKNFGDFREMFYGRYSYLKQELQDLETYDDRIFDIEREIRSANEENNLKKQRILDYEIKLNQANDHANYVERKITSTKYEKQSVDNKISEMRAALADLEMKSKNYNEEIMSFEMDLQKANSEVHKCQEIHDEVINKNPLIETAEFSSKLKSLQNDKSNSKLKLWQRHKSEYEIYLKNNNIS